MEILRSILQGLVRRWSVWIAAAILILAAYGKWESSQMPEDTHVQVPAMPSPNARDYFMAAHQLLVRTSHGALDILGTTGNFDRDYAEWLPDKEDLVSKNQAAYAKFHAGLQYRCDAPVAKSLDDSYDDMPMSDLSRFVCTVGEVKAAHGDYAGATSDFLDCIKLGIEFQHGGGIVEREDGDSCDELGSNEIRHLLAKLTSPDARASALRLSRFDALRPSFAETMEFDKLTKQLNLLNTFEHPHWRDQWYGESDFGEDGILTGLYYLYRRLRIGLLSPCIVYDNYLSLMNQSITDVSKPWPLYKLGPKPRFPTNIFVADNDWEVEGGYFSTLVQLTKDRFLETELALRAYRLDHRHYPESLLSLVPAYLPAVPSDPFTDGMTLRYRLKSNDTYLLYSIGPDGVDDGGSKPIPGNYSVEKGDIVAGYAPKTSRGHTGSPEQTPAPVDKR